MEIAEEYGARVIVNESRRGASYARNAGAALAEGDIFFFVDADCVLRDDAIGTAVEAIQSGPDAVFGSYTRETRSKGFFTRFKNYQHHYTHQYFSEGTKSFWTGCGGAGRGGTGARRIQQAGARGPRDS